MLLPVCYCVPRRWRPERLHHEVRREAVPIGMAISHAACSAPLEYLYPQIGVFALYGLYAVSYLYCNTCTIELLSYWVIYVWNWLKWAYRHTIIYSPEIAFGVGVGSVRLSWS